MILIIVFTIIILIGISLLIAVISTSFLKKRSFKVKGRNYQTEFKDRYEERVEELKKEEGEKVKETEAKEFDYSYTKKAKGSFKWILISICILVVIFFASFFGYKGYKKFKETPKLYFCEDVNLEKQKPVHRSNTFVRGNVTIFIKSAAPIDTNRMKVDVYRINSKGSERFVSKNLTINPDWTSFSLNVLFDRLGTFRVIVSKENEKIIGNKKIYIVPDRYAFKPIHG